MAGKSQAKWPLQDLDKDGGILEWILKESVGRAWTGLIWLMTGASGGLLWSRKWNFGFQTTLGISWLYDELTAFSRRALLSLVVINSVCCMINSVCCVINNVCCVINSVCCMINNVCCMINSVCCMIIIVGQWNSEKWICKETKENTP